MSQSFPTTIDLNSPKTDSPSVEKILLNEICRIYCYSITLYREILSSQYETFVDGRQAHS